VNPLNLVCSGPPPRKDKRNSSSTDAETDGKDEHECCFQPGQTTTQHQNSFFGQKASTEPLLGLTLKACIHEDPPRAASEIVSCRSTQESFRALN
jgi:hypothetical protein